MHTSPIDGVSVAKRRYVLAISGGVDSVVLLDIFTRVPHELLIVAHFDHGIRSESADDARFVEGLAKKYNLTFETTREELGKDASEDVARQRRYAFLRSLAQKHDAEIVTAHHADDVIETIAINVARGTGWRGLAVLNNVMIHRPLLHKWKNDIYAYAARRRLEWVEDATNRTDAYLRNRVRKCIGKELAENDKKQLHERWQQQTATATAILDEVRQLLEQPNVYSRYFMTMLPYESAHEILRAVIIRAGGPSLLRAQLDAGALAIRVARPRTRHHIARGVILCCDKATWSIQSDKKMIP